MFAPPTTLCKTERAQSEGRAKCDGEQRGQGQYKGRSPKTPPEVLEELQ
jgi:hypothetical protein